MLVETCCASFLNILASFGSVFQGDHAGVEIATSAHDHWLQRYGLLNDKSRLIASRCLRSPSHLQGLVIDDYFSASVEDAAGKNEDSVAAKWLTCQTCCEWLSFVLDHFRHIRSFGLLVGAL